jgi:hypothetical protein
MIFHPVVWLLFFGAAFVACLSLIPLKMATPAPQDNVVGANANGSDGANAVVIGGDAAAPFALADGASRGPVPGDRGGGRGGGSGHGGAVLLFVLLVMLLLVLVVFWKWPQIHHH